MPTARATRIRSASIQAGVARERLRRVRRWIALRLRRPIELPLLIVAASIGRCAILLPVSNGRYAN